MRGIIDLFFDNDSRQRRDINQAQDNLAFVQQYAAGLDENVQRMFQTIRGQAEQLRVLAATVEVLMDTLEERGLLDETTLRARVADRLEPPEPPPAEASGSPYRGTQPTARPADEQQLPCTNCGTHVPASMTTMTENGVVCDDCMRRLGG